MILGFLVTVAYVPGWSGSVIPTGWVLLSCVLPFFLFRWFKVTWSHVFFFLFLVYACWSISWSQTPLWGIEYVWHLGVLYLCFLLGSSLDNLERVFVGLGWGMVVNSALAVAQFFGFDLVPVREAQFGLFASTFHPAAGLFYNSNLLSEAAALVLVGCIVYRRFGLAICCVPSLLLGDSRIACISAVLVLLAYSYMKVYRRKLWVHVSAPLIAFLLIPFALWFKGFHGISDRLSLWFQVPWPTWGSGPPFLVNGAYHAYNDAIEMVSVFGLGSVLGFLAFGLPWAVSVARGRKEGTIATTGLIISLAAFPLETPVAGFILCLVSGYLARDLLLVRVKCSTLGDVLRRRVALERSIKACLGEPNLPLQPNHQPRVVALP